MNAVKKSMACWMTTLCVAVASATTQEQVIDEETLEKRIENIYRGDYSSLRSLHDNVRERILEGGVSPEWVTTTLEHQIRECLPILEEMGKHDWHFENGLSKAYRAARQRVAYPVVVLREFPGPDTLALIRECSFSTDSVVSDCAVASYVAVAGGDSVPFLREYVAGGGDGRSRRLSRNLRWDIKKFKERNKNDDAAGLNAFLLELLHKEERWGNVESIDEALCMTLDGYEQSVQRAQAIQKCSAEMRKTNNTVAQERYRKTQAEVEKTPENARKDFRSKGELLDPDRLKELNERKRE